MKRTRVLWALAAAAVFSAPVLAAEDDKQGDVNVALRAGVGGFTGNLDNYTSAGPAWGVGVNLQPFRFIGIEVGYEGSRNTLVDQSLMGGGSPNLQRHGASAIVRLAPPLIERIKPFIGAGLGASYVSTDSTSGAYRGDFMQEVPVVAGLEFNSGAITAGVRATYRFLVDEGFADGAQDLGNPEGGLFDTSFTLGARF